MCVDVCVVFVDLCVFVRVEVFVVFLMVCYVLFVVVCGLCVD